MIMTDYAFAQVALAWEPPIIDGGADVFEYEVGSRTSRVDAFIRRGETWCSAYFAFPHDSNGSDGNTPSRERARGGKGGKRG